ncbi:hypothetical protein ACDA63_18720 [Uliginosibacterium sp. sgz301328]|uniref:hypothetical protein n=1 Tax=Uliginosibacterium sp. sgz301328 TaxID=3243764 RepID=UPI00359D8146
MSQKSQNVASTVEAAQGVITAEGERRQAKATAQKAAEDAQNSVALNEQKRTNELDAARIKAQQQALCLAALQATPPPTAKPAFCD